MSRFHRDMLDSETAARFVGLKPGETVAMIGRCPEPRCRRGVRVELPGWVAVAPDSPHFAYADHGGQWTHGLLDRARAAGYEVPEGHGVISGGSFASNYLRAEHTCPEHGWAFVFKGLKATLVSTVACSGECEEATGEKCRCSCGGANHGARAA